MTIPAGLIAQLVTGGMLTLNLVVSANASDLNIRTLAVAAGWDGVSPVNLTLTINSGISVTSTSTSTPALQTGSTFPTGSIVKVINYGSILGKGGAGGASNSGVGGNGGNAFLASSAVTIDNQGTINAGSGGNGGNGASYKPLGSGGASYCSSYGGTTSNTYFCSVTANGAAGASGGTTGVNGSNGSAGSGATSTEPIGCPATYPFCGGAAGGAGGARGAYISGNSFVTWLNTGTRNGAVI